MRFRRAPVVRSNAVTTFYVSIQSSRDHNRDLTGAILAPALLLTAQGAHYRQIHHKVLRPGLIAGWLLQARHAPSMQMPMYLSYLYALIFRSATLTST